MIRNLSRKAKCVFMINIIISVVFIGFLGCESSGAGGPVPGIPGVPALTRGNTQISVSWDEPSNNGSAITSYGVQYRDSTADSWIDWSSSNNTTALITDLTNDTRYQVRIRAINANGSSGWSDATNDTPISGVPGAPSTPDLTGISTRILTDWDAPSFNGGSAVNGYNVQYRAGNSGSWQNWSHDGTADSTTITDLTNSTSYQVRIQSKNSNGNGAWSRAASAQVRPTLIIRNVVPFVSGEAQVTGARPLSDAIFGFSGNPVIRQVVRKGSGAVQNHLFFIGSDNKITIGNSSNTQGSFTPPPAATYTLTLGCEGCSNRAVDVEVRRAVAIFSIGTQDGDFGFSACYNWLNTASTLATDITHDGFAAPTARFFGSQTTSYNIGDSTIDQYDFREIDTNSHGLNLSDNAAGSGRHVWVYRSANNIQRTFTSSNVPVTIKQIAEINIVTGIWRNNGGAVIQELIGSSSFFWSFTASSGRKHSTATCSNASSNSSSIRGSLGNNAGADASLATYDCVDTRPHVLCVAK